MAYNFDEIIQREKTNSIKYDHRNEYFGSDDLIPMWVADMDFRTPDFIMEAIRERARHEILGYAFRGEGFYEAIIGWYRRRYQWEVKKEWIIFTPGVVPALNFAIRAFSLPGDEIILQPPVYHPFFSLVRDNGRKILYNQLLDDNDTYLMDIQDLSAKISDCTKLIVLSHPHNPVGRVWSEQELTLLGNLCFNRHILVLSDEIHSDLVFKPACHHSFASLNEDFSRNSITFASPSKTFNIAGLSTSFAIIPDEKLRENYVREFETSHLWLGNIFGSVALETGYNRGDTWLEELLAYLGSNLDFLVDFIKENIPIIRVVKPQGTYLVWLDMHKVDTGGLALREFLIRKARIGCNDGSTFGPGGEGFQRMNIACPRTVLKEALNRLRDAIKKQ